MLLVGVDWAEAEHAACLLDPSGGVQQRLKIPHSPAGLRRLQAVIAAHEPHTAEVLVASSPQAQAIRAIARDDERASRDERRLLNRLRADLLAVFPQALEAFPNLATISALAFL